MTLSEGNLGERYTIAGIDAHDEELRGFLLTLGCYAGENIVMVSRVGNSCVVSIRDGRYHIDKDLAEAILVA